MATQTISVLVNNQPGVLARIADLFSHRGFNIDKLTVGKYTGSNVSRMKILTTLDDVNLRDVIHQLETSIDVIQVKAVSHRIPQNVTWNRLRNLVSSETASFWLVAYSLFITLLGTNLPAPLYAIYRTQWNLSSGMVTFVFAVYALVVIPTIVISGQLSDRIGRKKVLLAGVLFSIMGSFGFALSNGIGMILLSRLFQGLSVGVLNGVAVAAMTELEPKQDRIKSAFVAAIAVTIGNALGPVLSGFLGDYAPYPTKLSYMIHFLFAIPSVIGLFCIHEKIQPSLTPLQLRKPYLPKNIQKPFYLSSTTSFLAWGIMSLMLSIIPSYLGTIIGKNNLSISGGIIALVLGLSTIHQLMLKKRPIRTLITIGYTLLILGLIGMILTIITKSLWFLIFTTVLIGLGHGPTYAGSLALVNQVSPNTFRVDVVSSFYVVTYMGVSIPILVLGFASQWIGLNHAIEWFSVIMGCMIVVSWVYWYGSKS
ncbi:acetolactate synthase small subunit [Ammoniphilus resinae]|uniref:acetolactate synthase n=1 Tax=Ammoniphilus resinae TaxID=861532 RepID=A0ABS4GWY0_9BACL|nr:acetolactate synthase small subunit [Ammoniphilus resinae]MBP1934537.1 MFS family permease/acetolactate synthase regulatory subunit [Ammoniphilus resinae]